MEFDGTRLREMERIEHSILFLFEPPDKDTPTPETDPTTTRRSETSFGSKIAREFEKRTGVTCRRLIIEKNVWGE